MSYPNLSQETINNLTEFFQFVDKDNDGYITVAEIREACAVDINNDGVISEDEKDRTSRVWIQTYFGSQDLNSDMKVSLHELLTYNNSS
jgi:Ca2+-binding EF-hand superfamily protein